MEFKNWASISPAGCNSSQGPDKWWWHYRKCPTAWDSKWLLYAWCLWRTGMMKRWLLSPVKLGAILLDEKRGRLWNTRDGSKHVSAGKRAPAGSPVCELQAVSVEKESLTLWNKEEFSEGRRIITSSQQIWAVDKFEFPLCGWAFVIPADYRDLISDIWHEAFNLLPYFSPERYIPQHDVNRLNCKINFILQWKILNFKLASMLPLTLLKRRHFGPGCQFCRVNIHFKWMD